MKYGLKRSFSCSKNSVCSILFMAVSILAFACATGYTGRMRDVTSSLRSGRTEEALEEYRESFTDSTGKDRLLYLMELGNLMRFSGRYDRAIDLLLQADRLSDQQRGTELDQEVLSFLSSDLSLEFRGADYEKVFINYCLAACYASQGNMEDALVECRRVNDKLKVLNTRYEEHKNRYSDDAFIRYMMGILYEKAGDSNNALIAYRNSAAVYDSVYSRDYGIDAPTRVRADILRLSSELGMSSVFNDYSSRWPGVEWEQNSLQHDQGEIVVILEYGTVPPRVEVSRTFYVDDRVYRMTLPAIPEKGWGRSHRVSISCAGLRAEGFLAEDVTAIAEKNLEDQAGRNVARAVARLVVKAGMAQAGEEIVEELTEEDSGISQAAGFLVSLLGAATERADLRAWLTLPSRIYVARLAVPSGQRTATVSLDGRVVYSGKVDVTSGGISLLFLRKD